MASNVFFLWSCLFSSLIYPGIHGGTEQETHHESNMQLFYDTNNNFAFRLYKSIVAQPGSESKNLFFSPLSVSTALAALSLGAAGQTHQELFSGLGFNSSLYTSEEVHQAFLNLLQILNQRTGVDLEFGSALYVQDTFKSHPEFLEKMKRFYLADGFSVDFTKTTETTQQINNYVSQKTQGKISKFIDNLNPNTLMYLLSYIYFKGKWSIPFDPSFTQEKIFHVYNETVQVPMMYEEGYYDVFYDHELSAQVLCLHYNDSFSMILVLPDKDITALEEVVAPLHIAKWMRWVKKSKYEIYIPKLSLKTSYSLKDILTKMGMTDMFTRKADFTGISSENVFVSEVMQQVSLDVDEAGATAAAVTGIRITPLSWSFTPVLNFNRPFMIFVIDQQTKNVLFMGKIVNPAKTQ